MTVVEIIPIRVWRPWIGAAATLVIVRQAIAVGVFERGI